MTVSVTKNTEGKYIGDVLKFELHKLYNRETVTLDEGQSVEIGSVLGIVTATGEYAAYDNGAATGVEIAKAIALEAVDATAGPLPIAVLARGAAVVSKDDLVFLGTQDDTAKDAAYADLEALDIVIRTTA